MSNQALVAIGVFLITYGLIISEKIHRTIVAVLGGLIVIVLGIISQETAVHHIDFNTLGLLIGMMIIVAITAQTGLFNYVAVWSAKKVQADPRQILIALSIITGLFSALLDNVTTVLLMVPVTFSITRQLKINPMPYLISQVLASNIGGTATLIGDPPNIMIGSAVKELTFMAFIYNLSAISFLILFVTVYLLGYLYRNQLVTDEYLKAALMTRDERMEILDAPLLRKCLTVIAVTFAGFFAHQALHLESATVALAGAFLLLLVTYRGEHDLEHVFRKVEWPTIFFFVGLFVLVGSLVETGVISLLAKSAIAWTGGDVTTAAMLILWLSAIASAFVDNIPFVATMIPLIQDMGQLGIANLEPLWWSLALGACLGGNGTLIGASANLIVAGLAAQEGHPIRFVDFLKIGFPMMILSIVMSTVYIYLRYL